MNTCTSKKKRSRRRGTVDGSSLECGICLQKKHAVCPACPESLLSVLSQGAQVFLEMLATPLHAPKKFSWPLQHPCKKSPTENGLVFATVLQVSRKTGWCLQHSCKHFQERFNRYEASVDMPPTLFLRRTHVVLGALQGLQNSKTGFLGAFCGADGHLSSVRYIPHFPFLEFRFLLSSPTGLYLCGHHIK